jgi:hypothetical protein
MNRSKIVCILVAPVLLLAGMGSGKSDVVTSVAAGGSIPATVEALPIFHASLQDRAPAAPVVSPAGTTIATDEARSLLDASVKDRSAEVLATPVPAAPSLGKGNSSGKFKAKRDKEKPFVAARKERLKGHGFQYTSALTTIQVVEISGTASEATVKFDEFGTLYMASDATGPSDLPEQYRVHETAKFINGGPGWVLDEAAADDGQASLPFSMVDPKFLTEPATAATPRTTVGKGGATPGVPTGNANPKPTAASPTPARPGAPTIVLAAAPAGLNYNSMMYYAMGHYLVYNAAYRSWPQDCTNFISQALREGGWSFINGWYLSDDAWWYDAIGQSRPWTYAPSLFNFATRSTRTYELAYLNDMGPADIMQADWANAYPDGVIDHTMMVTSWSTGGPRGLNDIRVTFHTTDTLNKSIWTIYDQNPGAIWYALRT